MTTVATTTAAATTAAATICDVTPTPPTPQNCLDLSFPSEAELRSSAEALIPGPSVFEVSPSNILDYRCGSWALIARDIKIVLPAESAQHILEHLDASGLQQAFRVRQELVNYKKVLLHVHQQGAQLARSLSQLATFFHDESLPCEGGFSMPTERRGRITDAATQCKGRAEGTYDARLLGKLLCNLPRHPAKARPRDLQDLPRTMRCWRVLTAANIENNSKDSSNSNDNNNNNNSSISSISKAPEEGTATDEAKHAGAGKAVAKSGQGAKTNKKAGDSEVAAADGEVDDDEDPNGGNDIVADPMLQKTVGPSAALVKKTTWPEHIKDFVRLVLISRGGDKALRIREELEEVRSRLGECIAAAERALSLVQARPAPGEVAEKIRTSLTTRNTEARGHEQHAKIQMGVAMQRQRDFNLLSGCLPVLRETLHWLAAIEDAAASDAARLFLAGDGRGVPTVRYGARPDAPPTFCTPKGFTGGSGPEDQEMVRVVQEYSQQMQAILASEGWPATICCKIVGEATAPETHGTTGASAAAAAAAGKGQDGEEATEAGGPTAAASRSGGKRTPCIHCGRRFSALWLQQGVCCQCEATWRARGTCPFAKTCLPVWFCSHHQRCLKCECQSCEECRFTRGDGEHVRLLAARLRPKRIVLDFDRTLASTRSGAVPVVGKDSIDDDLFSLIWDFPDACMVVTRNRHVDEIKSFLAALDVPRIDVHSLKRPRSKAEFVLMGLRGNPSILEHGPETASDNNPSLEKETQKQKQREQPEQQGCPTLQTPQTGSEQLTKDDLVLFVDDTLAELMETEIAKSPSVHRVLFRRGLL